MTTPGSTQSTVTHLRSLPAAICGISSLSRTGRPSLLAWKHGVRFAFERAALAAPSAGPAMHGCRRPPHASKQLAFTTSSTRAKLAVAARDAKARCLLEAVTAKHSAALSSRTEIKMRFAVKMLASRSRANQVRGNKSLSTLLDAGWSLLNGEAITARCCASEVEPALASSQLSLGVAADSVQDEDDWEIVDNDDTPPPTRPQVTLPGRVSEVWFDVPVTRRPLRVKSAVQRRLEGRLWDRRHLPSCTDGADDRLRCGAARFLARRKAQAACNNRYAAVVNNLARMGHVEVAVNKVVDSLIKDASAEGRRREILQLRTEAAQRCSRRCQHGLAVHMRALALRHAIPLVRKAAFALTNPHCSGGAPVARAAWSAFSTERTAGRFNVTVTTTSNWPLLDAVRRAGLMDSLYSVMGDARLARLCFHAWARHAEAQATQRSAATTAAVFGAWAKMVPLSETTWV
jgi:hypothetical protein